MSLLTALFTSLQARRGKWKYRSAPHGRAVEDRSLERAAGTARQDLLVTISVWSCQAFMSAMAFVLIFIYARNVPFADEYGMVPVLTGAQPVTLTWLWSQHNEHRIFLSKLIQVGLAKLTDTDFRAGMVFNALLMTACSIQMLVVAKRLRGSHSYADACFPLALLNWGNYENLHWSFQVTFCLSTFLICTILFHIIQCHDRLSGKQTLIVGACLLLLPLCGAQGTLMVAPVALWMAYGEWRDARQHGLRPMKHLIRLALPVLACALNVFYFVGYQNPSYHPHSSGWRAARGTIEFFAVGLGPAVKTVWPCIHAFAILASASVIAGLALVWKNRSSERYCVGGLFLFFAATVALACAIGKGRAFLGPHLCEESRYAWLSIPTFCWIYLAAFRCERPAFAVFVQGCLLVAVVFLAKGNFDEGRDGLRKRRQIMMNIEQAAREGMNTYRMGDKFGVDNGLGPRIVPFLELLRKKGLGPFSGIAKFVPEQPRYPMFTTQPRSVAGTAVVEAETEGKTCLIVCNPGMVVFDLRPEMRRVECSFGILPGAYTRTDPTEGVEFVVECVAPTGARTIIWRRFLDPARVAADRGMQQLSVDLPIDVDGSALELRTTILPGHNSNCDWSYWTAVSVQ